VSQGVICGFAICRVATCVYIEPKQTTAGRRQIPTVILQQPTRFFLLRKLLVLNASMQCHVMRVVLHTTFKRKMALIFTINYVIRECLNARAPG